MPAIRYPRLLRTRLLLAFIAVGVVPLLLLAVFFTLFSIDYVTRAYNERALQHVAPVADDIEKVLLHYRHLAYVLAEDEVIKSVLESAGPPDRKRSLDVYRLLYRSLAGSLEHAALHVASRTPTPCLSTHRFPSPYQPVNPREGIYRLADASPERTVLHTQSYVNDKGEVVNFSFARAIRDAHGMPLGYVIVDLFKSHFSAAVKQRNDRFFSDVVVTDNRGYYAVDVLSPGNDGDFARFPYLRQIDRSARGVGIVGELVVSRVPILDGKLSVVASLPTKTSLEGVGALVAFTAWVVLGAATIATLVAALMARHISSPIHRLSGAMEEVEKGNLAVTVASSREDEIGSLLRGFDRMIHEIRALLDKTVREQEALRAAELRALQAQVNPHFLYNTLGAIKSIAKLHSLPEIVTITSELGRLLRKTLDNAEGQTTVAESVGLIRSYANIHHVRHPDRYRVEIDVSEDALHETMPALLLQPLVENAFVHGLEKKLGPGRLRVTGRVRDGELCLGVKDDGVGFDPSSLGADRRHIGLANVDRRLRLLFGDSYGLRVESAPGEGCAVTLRIPLRTTENAS